ncbi:MAG TPA: response regulator [Caulobacteraceae bacterium]|nr:response regulator [Caulobacteraceae bacterium]
MSSGMLESRTQEVWGLPPAGYFDPQPPRRVWALNVLLIDDDAADTALILNVLRRHPNVSTALATDAPEFALRQLETGRQMRPDLVLLDIQMPRLDGFAFLAALRRIPAMAAVPVVFLTTSCLSSDVAKTRQSTALLYVIKPETYLELQSRLNGVLRRVSTGRWSQ